MCRYLVVSECFAAAQCVGQQPHQLGQLAGHVARGRLVQHGVQCQRGLAEQRHAAVIHQKQTVLGSVQQHLQRRDQSGPAGAGVQHLADRTDGAVSWPH